MEEVLFKTEQRQSRAEIADHLRAVADKLEAGDQVTLSSGTESISLEVPARPTFEVKAEREQEGASSELSVEFELEWDENDDGSNGNDDAGLEIA
ncbi:amphi-Trp domain-containing protein [Natronomonas gomsonensis]|jgi:amphi-Trp domain-containing protein|uniref:amphi-Trp domain-containing protein n=1 Tax=Natronomonas gomsonensis TaxID=1046043 RepID=UPI0020CA33FD|nr:amphi-Trp domain-containing protein [Natronomonas gomsonensis]MCY4730382.1 amphi-Trp domain-containing protein [Natronomonas gomsonensis]